MKLSSNYTQSIQEQLEKLDKEFITHLVKHVRNNFILAVSVNGKGRFSLSEVDIKLRVECGRGMNAIETFREPIKVLSPFALFITNVEFRGYQHILKFVETEIKISAEDLLDIIEYPIIAPKTKDQWRSITSMVYLDAKEEYHYELSIPCIEGELYWDNKVKTLQFTLFDQKMTNGQL